MAGQTNEAGAGSRAGWVLLGVAALLAAGSIGYNVIGTGDEPAEVAQAGEAGPTLEELRAAAEASGDDAEPWAALGFALFAREDYAGAAEAYAEATAIDGDAAVLFSALGEALLYAEDAGAPDADPMPARALAAFERAVELDPTDPRARYFLGVKKDLDGDHEGAIADWLALLSDTPPGAPWEANLVQTIRQIGRINEIDTEQRIAAATDGRMPGMTAGAAASSVRGPTAEQVVAAQDMSQDDRDAMIEGMVAQLEARLESEPGDLDGWVMLMRSRINLGERDRARTALERAIAANPQEEAELRRQAAMLGIG
ncbi:MAG: cytochrome C biogenesis protein CycH [Erythrobacter sp.]|uniref:tetratricopeptide repeat protein n=1 Tax=Erythrobacter sp. TaxID=1042 RepID=UPI0032EDA924